MKKLGLLNAKDARKISENRKGAVNRIIISILKLVQNKAEEGEFEVYYNFICPEEMDVLFKEKMKELGYEVERQINTNWYKISW